ncbi:hypothetical protein CEXT_286641 [Caerostris extrusa]|uniref:Uncharacterized protein n=1 Tax=Caerostris extrusa TaxID=172846 RepID=A0AAV4U444_CAEEX|nr:hypothetical protein CEXT_286641 [Caerostris extrusa]
MEVRFALSAEIPRLSEEASNIDTPVLLFPLKKGGNSRTMVDIPIFPVLVFRFVGVGQREPLATLLQSLDSVNNYPNKRVKVARNQFKLWGS